MMSKYRSVLSLPGVSVTMLVMLFARLPQTASGVTITLHVLGSLDRGYAAAGTVGAVATIGAALGAPIAGRLVDRVGLRPLVLFCGFPSIALWLVAPAFSYPVLLVAAFPCGALTLPASSLARQVLATQVPAERQRTAYSLDSMAVEFSFMIGPAAGVLLITQFSSAVALRVIGLALATATVTLWWLNPPVHTAAESVAIAEPRPTQRHWLTPALFGTFLVVTGALFVLMGMEIATIAVLRSTGEVRWTGVVIAAMCVASLLGGLVHGAVRRSLSQLSLMLSLAVLVLPVVAVDGPWWLLALALVPPNLACAPTIAATAEAVSAQAPASVRGLAMGLQSSAMMAGAALGNPVTGAVVDHLGPSWGFVAAGTGGVVFGLVALVLARWGRPPEAPRAAARPRSYQSTG